MTFAQEQKVYFLILCNKGQILSLQEKLQLCHVCLSLRVLCVFSFLSMRACSKTLKLCATGNQYSPYSVSAVQDDVEYITGKICCAAFAVALNITCKINSFRYLISFDF